MEQSQIFQLEEYREKMLARLENTEGTNLFNKALDFAFDNHKGQVRKSGEPYITHPCSVAEILLFDLELRDTSLLAAALLHDIVEDVKDVTISSISDQFGDDVAAIVDGCTKLTRYRMNRQEVMDLTHSKLLCSASQRIEVFLVKLADRLHNLTTISSLSLPKRQRIARETIDIYAPIASRMNIRFLKQKLFHHALLILYPKASKKLQNVLQKEVESIELKTFVNKINHELSKEKIAVDIMIRPKGLDHFYDPMNKVLKTTYTENLTDLVVVLKDENILDCYRVMGIVNSIVSPIPRKIRDFIANPKSNGYKSLHVRYNVEGKQVLMLIRTQSMDIIGSRGILSELSNKQKISDLHLEDLSELFRTIGEYEGDRTKRLEIVQAQESKEIYLYTPTGETVSLPIDSIVLDFAYKIHTEIGNDCIGATINGERVGIDGILRDGQTVHIRTSPDQTFWPFYLETKCKTAKARSAVNRQINQRKREFASMIGKEILTQTIQKLGLPHDILSNAEDVELIRDIYNIESLDDVYRRIGQDHLSPLEFLYYFDGIKNKHLDSHITEISIDCPNNLFYKFSKCCNPYPGLENVVGVLTDQGISLHMNNCSDLKRHEIPLNKQLIIIWKNSGWNPTTFSVEVKEHTVFDLIREIAKLSFKAEIQNIQEIEKGNKVITRIDFVTNNMLETKMIFGIFPKDCFTILSYK